ncbi:MAG: tetratricopeptide repeat protein [Thermoguttaceae bacterium]|jgi:tetratricopeptide (TPR) repeat protein|nr:tetratricopeptide repeat protein [Thermoguttaceae bacterium]
MDAFSEREEGREVSANEADRALERFRANQRSHWEALAGPHLGEMLQSRENARQHLTNPDPRIRLAALQVLEHVWNPKPGDDLSRECERMALEDADPQVRSSALFTLGACYHGTDDLRIGKLLAGVVRDDAQPSGCRQSAYLALYAIKRQRFPAGLVRTLAQRSMRIPDEIDWAFVDSFLVEGRPTKQSADTLQARIQSLPEPFRTAARHYREGCNAYDNARFEESIGHLTRAIRASPQSHGPYLVRARCLLKLGKLDEAIMDLSKVVELRPELAAAYQARAEAYRQKGLVEMADADLRRAWELDPGLKRFES